MGHIFILRAMSAAMLPFFLQDQGLIQFLGDTAEKRFDKLKNVGWPEENKRKLHSALEAVLYFYLFRDILTSEQEEEEEVSFQTLMDPQTYAESKASLNFQIIFHNNNWIGRHLSYVLCSKTKDKNLETVYDEHAQKGKALEARMPNCVEKVTRDWERLGGKVSAEAWKKYADLKRAILNNKAYVLMHGFELEHRKKTREAFAMALHPRLGKNSVVGVCTDELVRMILNMI